MESSVLASMKLDSRSTAYLAQAGDLAGSTIRFRIPSHLARFSRILIVSGLQTVSNPRTADRDLCAKCVSIPAEP